MGQTNEISELIKALCKAKREFKPIIKDGKNPFLNTKYVTLDAIVNATEDALNENGLVIIHHQELRGEDKFLVTELIHESGQIKPTETSMNEYIGTVQLNEKGNVKVNPLQIFGSVLTYLKRYHIGQLLNVAVDEDSDGNSADTGKKQQSKSEIEILHAKYFGLLASKKLNEQQRHDWQVENIGKDSINDWLIADYQKAIDILQSKEKQRELPEQEKTDYLSKLRVTLSEFSTIEKIDEYYNKNSKIYAKSVFFEDIKAIYIERKKELVNIIMAKNMQVDIQDLIGFREAVNGDGIDKSLIEQIMTDNPEACKELKTRVERYIKERNERIEAEASRQESNDGEEKGDLAFSDRHDDEDELYRKLRENESNNRG